MKTLPLLLAFVVTGFGSLLAAEEPFAKAEKLAKEQHWAEARAAYDEARKAAGDWHAPRTRQAVEGAVTCLLQLKLWDEAIARAEEFNTQTKGSLEEVIGRRFEGGLYLRVPHHGTKQGGRFLRGESGQGVYVYSWKKDRKAALAQYERARDLVLWLREHFDQAANPDTPERRKQLDAELIGLDFDLVATLAAQTEYNYGARWGLGGWWWGPGWEPEEDSEAVEQADYDEPNFGRGWYNANEDQEPPTGIPLGPDGRPQFLQTPAAYSSELGAGPRIRYLLAEIQRLDTSEKKEAAAKALLRSAMIARTLYGPETVQAYRSALARYDRTGRPLAPEKIENEPKQKIWELGDDQAITIAGGRLQLVDLPPGESPLALLGAIETRYPQSALVPEAYYTRALYYQTRMQFPQALAGYQALLERFPKHPRVADAQRQIEGIKGPGVIFGNAGVYLPDAKPKLSFTYRNADKVQLKATRFDLIGYIGTELKETKGNYWQFQNIPASLFQDERWKKFLREPAGAWEETVRREEGNRAAEGATEAPLSDPGAYVVEARVPGAEQPTQVLVLVTDIAMVQKNAKDFGLIYICDARTGQPLPGKPVRLYEHWTDYNQSNSKNTPRVDETTQTTDADGVVKFKRQHSHQGSSVEAVVAGDRNRMAFSFFQNFNEAQYVQGDYAENGRRIYIVTDRPVYRPGSTVQFRLWERHLVRGAYAPPTKEELNVQIWDAKNNQVQMESVKLDDQGGASGSFTLGAEPPLGIYTVRINGSAPDGRNIAGGLFRVEEYKKPEFEVSVKPSTTQAKLGEKFKARIEACYYFGAPVAQGKVSYKVFRENYTHLYAGAGEYDWLYGKGYGRVHYAYPWFSWWGRWGCYIGGDGWWPWAPGLGTRYAWGWYGGEEENYGSRWQGGSRKALRELVAQGTADLKPDGTYEVEVDTARAKAEQGEHDHRYTIEAEVRDASRRTIEGKGSVIVTRQEFYAFVETDGGWYDSTSNVQVEVRTLTPDNVPVAAKGEVVVQRIRYAGARNDEVQEEEVKRWAAETDADGRLAFKWPVAGEGQWRISFRAQDSRHEEVLGNAVFWARGPKFDGRVYRFNDLELIADKRSYKVGETAHLLVNVAENNARILFSDSVTHGSLLSYRFIDIPQRSTVIDLPIGENRVPNFFVEATLVRNGRIHSEVRELFAPPEHGLLNVSVKTDKPIYRAGEKGKITVEATDFAGQPVAGQVALTAFDEAVTYIQDEFGPSPRVFFHGQKRYHRYEATSSTDHLFAPKGMLRRPELEMGYAHVPEGWSGSWGLQPEGMDMDMSARSADDRAIDSLSFGDLAATKARSSVAAAAPMAQVDSGAMSIRATGSLNLGAGFATSPGAEPALVEPEIRTNFADTALWLPALKLDEKGRAETEITFPDSLTTWRVHGYAITKSTQVGDSTTKATSTKNLIVRLQAPRFFVERDEVVLSANVNNYLATAQPVKAELIVPAALFRFMGPVDGSPAADAEGNFHFFAEAKVEAKGEHRFDWPMKVLKPGLAKITVKALTSEESDGMRLAFPVLVHGVSKMVAQSGSYRVDHQGERALQLDLPAEIDPEQTRLEITLSPSLGGVMIDALPYLASYPYGCVEQTMSRFYPTVLVRHTLKTMGTDLETIGQQRKQMNAADLQHRFGDAQKSAVFDTAELDRMTKAGLERIYGFQRTDGGWGWWREDDSSPHQTAYVLQGLHAAKAAGVHVDDGVFSRGLSYLQNFIIQELAKPKNKQEIGDLTTQAYLAYILSLEQRLQIDDLRKWAAGLYTQRADLNNYGRALLALTMQQEKKPAEAGTLLRNLLQYVQRDDSNETAWVRTPEQGWWFWWNNDIETNAWALKAIVAIDPKSDLAPRLVKWLLNNRRHGYYWRSTRDTAQVIAAMTDFMQASGEGAPDYNLTVNLDGVPVKEVKVTKQNLFSFDNRILLQGLQVKPGPHKITITKNGTGALYYSSYLTYFTKEEDVKGAGNEIFVERSYYKLVPKSEEVKLPAPAAVKTGPANQPVALELTGRTELRAGYTRVPLKTGDAVTSGDQIEVVLKITAKNTYDYLAFEDMKPAGCEPVELRSGGRWAGGLCANLELRDEKVVFFIGLLEQGEHILRYKLRAETPGTFHALPTSGSAMYAPEVRGISDEMRLKVTERP